MVLRYLAKATTTLIILIIRGKAIAPLLIAIVIPSAIATIFLLTVNIVNSQSNVIISSYMNNPSLIYSRTPIDNTSCTEIFVKNTFVKTFNTTFEAQIHFVNDFKKYIEMNRLVLIRSNEYHSNITVSIGLQIMRKYNINPNSKISILINGKYYSLNITHIHHGSKYLDHIIIVSGIDYSPRETQYLCKTGSNLILANIVNNLRSSILQVMWFLSLFTLIAYIPILYLAFNKILSVLKKDINILHYIGLSNTYIRYGFIVANSIICMLLVLYGFSIGILLVHLSIWLLRFFGIVIIEKPILSLNMCFSLITAFLVISFTILFIVSKRIGDHTWSGL